MQSLDSSGSCGLAIQRVAIVSLPVSGVVFLCKVPNVPYGNTSNPSLRCSDVSSANQLVICSSKLDGFLSPAKHSSPIYMIFFSTDL